MKGGSVSVVCKGYITKVVWRAILALSGAWGPRELVISDILIHSAPSDMDLLEMIESMSKKY